MRCAPTDGLNGACPFEILYGRSPVLPENLYLGYSRAFASDDPTADLIYHMTIAQEDVYAFLHSSQARYEENAETPPSYAPGDLVLIRSPFRVTNFKSRKLLHRYIGPYRIVKVISPVTYSLKPIKGGRLSTVHLSRMRRYYQQPSPIGAPSVISDLHSTPIDFDASPDASLDPFVADNVVNPTPPIPDITSPPTDEPVSDQVEEVESIVDKLVDEDGDTQYKVHWKNTASSEDTWHLASDLKHCRRLINAYNRRHK